MIKTPANLKTPTTPVVPPAAAVRRLAVGEAVVRSVVEIREAVVLAGSTRPGPLSVATGRSLLELPVAPRVDGGEWTAADLWLAAAAGLASEPARGDSRRFGLTFVGNDTLRVIDPPAGVDLTVAADPADYRGTGGVLRDVLGDRDPGSWALVAEGTRALCVPLAEIQPLLIEEASRADIVLARDGSGDYAGLALVRIGCLRDIPDVGFIDFKEQALPRLAEKHTVRVLTLPWDRVSVPLRNLAGYTAAIDAGAMGRLWLPDASANPTATQAAEVNASGAGPQVTGTTPTGWRGAVVEAGAAVDPTARVYASAVLAGAKVNAGAVLVRCVVCEGAVVAARTRAAGMIIRGDARKKPVKRRLLSGGVA